MRADGGGRAYLVNIGWAAYASTGSVWFLLMECVVSLAYVSRFLWMERCLREGDAVGHSEVKHAYFQESHATLRTTLAPVASNNYLEFREAGSRITSMVPEYGPKI